jgi:hypothetical protein
MHPTLHASPLILGRDRDVTHACPECPLGTPDPFCACCGGHGNVTPKRLAQWQLRVLADLPPGLR